MINNPDWLKPEGSAYFHQISQDCIRKLVECMEGIDIEDMDCDTCIKMQEILSDEIDDPDNKFNVNVVSFIYQCGIVV